MPSATPPAMTGKPHRASAGARRGAEAKHRGGAEAKRQGAHVEEMQRRRLLLAMVEVLAEVGFEGASVGRVCKRAGVSRRTFYEIFEDRDECLLAAFDAAVERLSGPVVLAWEEAGSWRERIRRALGVLLERLDAEPDVARMCIVETLKAGPAVSRRRGEVIAALVGAVELGRSESKPSQQPPPLAGQGVVGGALAVVHERLLGRPPAWHDPRQLPSNTAAEAEVPADGGSARLADLTGALAGLIVHPYLGSTVARRELERAAPKSAAAVGESAKDPFKGLAIRFTYRTALVLATIAAESTGGAHPSNRVIAEEAGVADEGQMSRLLARLQKAGLIENRGEGHLKGEANAWALTERGEAVQAALAGR